MKVTTKEDYQKRHKPEPKKGKSRKGSLVMSTNYALWNRIEDNEKAIKGLQLVVAISGRALIKACAPRGLTATGKTPEEYCVEAEKELMKEAKADE